MATLLNYIVFLTLQIECEFILERQISCGNECTSRHILKISVQISGRKKLLSAPFPRLCC